MLPSPKSTGMPHIVGARGGFWAGPIAQATMNGHRLRFFDPRRAPSFPEVAIGDFVDALELPDQIRPRFMQWMRRIFDVELRWRWSRPNFVRTVPLWGALSAIEELSTAGHVDRSKVSAFLRATAVVVLDRIGDVSEAEGGEIVTACLGRMTSEIGRATARLGRGA